MSEGAEAGAGPSEARHHDPIRTKMLDGCKAGKVRHGHIPQEYAR